MRTKTFLAGLFALSVAAVAQAQFIEGSRGTGLAASSNAGNDARFLYAVARYSRGNTEYVEGEFNFTARSERGTIMITGRPTRLAIDARTKVAEFAGRAVAVYATPFGPRRVEGTFMARVQDRGANGRGDRDTIAVAFASLSNAQFDYRGLVTDGDLIVVPRS
ncbi:MAG: hypothetical protein KF884_10135 [Fimbriimonadaceae bacterium]|nr:hypothetical protein [Fimbriimonadaceae bacterium]QYK57905.1 MAG: hypothetical protein KF884_10135 [Fimbriimonadaceae bacterium]